LDGDLECRVSLEDGSGFFEREASDESKLGAEAVLFIVFGAEAVLCRAWQNSPGLLEGPPGTIFVTPFWSSMPLQSLGRFMLELLACSMLFAVGASAEECPMWPVSLLAPLLLVMLPFGSEPLALEFELRLDNDKPGISSTTKSQLWLLSSHEMRCLDGRLGARSSCNKDNKVRG
jgi:hypothetical protein